MLHDRAAARDKAECIELSSAFAYFLDRREYAALADLFTEDGVWTRYGIDLRGHDAIVLELNKRPANQFTRHVTTSHHFTSLTENVAAAVSCNLSFFSFDEGAPPSLFKPGNTIVLDFEDTYAQTPRGWRFTSRISQPLLIPAALWHQFTNNGEHAPGSS